MGDPFMQPKWRTFALMMAAGIFLMSLFLAGGCGPNLKDENEKLKKEVADLSAENEKLKGEVSKLRTDASAAHTQMADLNMQISNLQTQNQALGTELDKLKVQLKGKKR